MSSVLEPPVETPAEESPYLFSVDDFYRMVDRDIFPDDNRVFLWDGRIYEKMARKHPHSICWGRLNTAVVRALPADWSVWGECAIAIGPRSVPLPDLLIVRGTFSDFDLRRPEARDVGLLVEVADSSLRIDTGAKLAAYARAGIPAYWVFNLKANVIQAYSDPIPAEGRYQTSATVGRDGTIPLVLDGRTIATLAASDLLPAR